jgi:hypothetical protein
MSYQQHASFWEEDEAPAVRRFRLWERAAHGASLTLGKAPPPPIRRPYRATDLPPTPPMLTEPRITPDNCQAIIAEVLAHHHVNASEIGIGRKGSARISICVQELAYLLLVYGRRDGELLSLTQIGKLLHRHHTSVQQAIRRHQTRLRQIEGQDAEA